MSREYKGLDLWEPLSESPNRGTTPVAQESLRKPPFTWEREQRKALPYLTSGTVTELSAMLVDRIICGTLNTTGGCFPLLRILSNS